MDVVIYSKNNEQQIKILHRQIRSQIKIEPVMIRSLEALFKFFESKISADVIIVFMIYSEEELDTLLAGKSRLFNTNYIIILKEDRDPLVSKALALKPRFLSFLADDYTMTGKVLAKIMNKNKYL